MSIRTQKLAREIAKALMTIHGDKDVVVERIQLMKKQDNGSEKNMGGRCRQSVVEIIEELL